MAFPDGDDAPTGCPQLARNTSISPNILLELHCPERNAGLRYVGVVAVLVAVPETPVHEDHGPVAGERNVRSSRK